MKGDDRETAMRKIERWVLENTKTPDGVNALDMVVPLLEELKKSRSAPPVHKFEGYFGVYCAVQLRTPIVGVQLLDAAEPWVEVNSPVGKAISGQNGSLNDENGDPVSTDFLGNVMLLPNPSGRVDILGLNGDYATIYSVDPADVLCVSQVIPPPKPQIRTIPREQINPREKSKLIL